MRSSRVGTLLRLVVLSALLCAGGLSGARSLVASQALAAPPPSCPPPLFGPQPPATDGECQASKAQLASSPTLPAGFSESIIFSGLETPTAVRFASDGRVFIAEKSGLIKVFANLNATTPTIVADLSGEVMDYYDRGLLSIALDPNFPATPDLYALYTYDAPIGGIAPVWQDHCDDPFGATTEGCVVSGRLSRFRLNDAGVAGPEQVLINAWCQQFPSHSVGDLAFGPDGALYVSAGEGANFTGVDAGQYGTPNSNPCGDPFDASIELKEGGALRAQDARTSGDPLGYDGTVLRVNPADPTDRRIVAYGFRNPFRITARPGTNELWVGNVGWDTWETLNRVRNMTDGSVTNFGWPCYEGAARQQAYEAANLPLCTALYTDTGAVTPPVFAYQHYQPLVQGDGCKTTDSSITSVAFYTGGSYPAAYNGAVFFGDYARNCIWVMTKGANGDPDPATVALFEGNATGPVDLRSGPGGDIFYLDIYTGTLRRIRYLTPTAAIQADKTSGLAPLTVHFDGQGSSNPTGGPLTYSWDLDGNGSYGDATGATAERTYGSGSFTVGLRVTNKQGQTDTTTVVINSGAPPTVAITTPTADATWQVGTVFTFAGTATDQHGTALPASAYTWTLILNHCPSGITCHIHILQRFDGVTGGTFTAPDHEYPSSLELRLTVHDADGLTSTKSVLLLPQTVNLNITSDPMGMSVAVNATAQTTPFSRTVIKGSANTLSPPVQNTDSNPLFTGWVVDGQEAGWTNPLVITASQDRFVKAVFGANPGYTDVPPDSADFVAITQLGARGVIKGYGDGTFGPHDTILRAQMAALIARAMGWGNEHWNNPFPDQGTIDGELWQAVGTLNHFGVAKGYSDGTYNPTGEVLYAQAVSFITRAMVAKGYWVAQADDPALYPEVSASSGHRGDIATYVHYAGALPNFPRGQPFGSWNQATTRAWFADALWQALDSYFRVDRVN
jgi:glucose/arabinose dehydrogenase